jgi:hypothetical protein
MKPVELQIIVHGSPTATTELEPIDDGTPTVEMLPIEVGPVDPEREDGLREAGADKLARGSDAVTPQSTPVVQPRGPRRPRATLRVEDIAATRAKKS